MKAPRFIYFLSIALLLLAIAGPLLVRDEKTGTEDFGHFYHAAAAMRAGHDIYAATDGHYIYPPLLAFVLQPLAAVPEKRAVIIWLVASALAVFCAAVIAAKEIAARWLAPVGEIAPHWPWIIAAVATLLTTDKLHKMFGLGQSDGFVLLGFALVLRWMNRRPWMAGAIVGAVANIKYLSVIFVPYFLVKRNFRAAVGALISFVLLLALPALQVGATRGLDYATAAFGGLGHMIGLGSTHRLKILDVTWDRSLSITSTLFRVTRAHGLADSASAIILLLIFAAVLFALIFLARENGVRLFRAQVGRVVTLEFAALIFCAVAFSPQTTARHMVLTLLINVVAIGVFLALKDSAGKILLAGALCLTTASLSLPAGGHALVVWRKIGGASWCAMLLMMALVWAGSRAIADTPAEETAQR